jgi:hypothetical protein
MSDYEARINTKFGELVIHFKDKEDLARKLLQVQEITSTVEQSIGQMLMKEPAKVLHGFEDLYAIESDGTIKLLKYPKQKADVLRLALFVSSVPLTFIQLKKVTGIDNPGSCMKAKDFIENLDGTYTLSFDARAEVVNVLIPSLRKSK